MNMEYIENFAKFSKQYVKDTEAFVAGLTLQGERVMVPCRGGEQEVFFHRGNGSCVPTIFEIHGGCFSQGISANDDSLRTRMCEATGYNIIGLGYRKSPDYPYPCALEDLYDEICYFVDHAEEYGIDVNRLSIWGHSAGGNLSCGMIWKGLEEKRFSFKVALLDYPYVDTYTWGEEVSQEEEDITADQVDAMNYIYAPRELRKEKWLSPVFASNEDLALFPPTVCVICELDPLAVQDLLLVNRLIEAGVPVTAKKYLKMEHGFVERWFFREWYQIGRRTLPGTEEAAENAVAFFAEQAKHYLQ